MAGTISLSLSQQFNELGEPLSEGRLYFYRAGTVSTPQNAFYDVDLTLPLPNPYTLDAAGRVPQFFLADGSIKIVLIDRSGVTQINADNILVIGPSGGGGGGGSVDPTTVIQTGQLALWYGTGSRTGFVRLNGRTIGSATSGATERANADTQLLFLFLYAEDTNLAVSGGRGASAAADWAANKTITLPDGKGRIIGGLDDMGASAAGRLTATYFGTSPIVLGAVSTPTESKTLLTENLPPYTPAGSIASSSTLTAAVSGNGGPASAGGTGQLGTTIGSNNITSTFTGTAQGGTSTPFSIVQPTILMTFYMKL
jgi:hypothetical protein